MEKQHTGAAQARENPFMIHNNIRIGRVESDCAEVYLDICPSSTNRYGVVHGGAFFTMADCCAGLCARSDRREYVTQDASVQFVDNLQQGRVTARGQVFHRGRRICLVDVRITDASEKLLFRGVFSMYCITPCI